MDHSELVPGDILIIKEGDSIPVDGLLLTSDEIKTDESALTGETDNMRKNSLGSCLQLRQELQTENLE